MTPILAIELLRSKGMSDAQIAAELSVSQPTISKIKRGKMVPNWELGEQLVCLAKRRRKTSRRKAA